MDWFKKSIIQQLQLPQIEGSYNGGTRPSISRSDFPQKYHKPFESVGDGFELMIVQGGGAPVS